MIYLMRLKQALSRNIDLLQKASGDSSNKMGNACGISPRMIGHIKKMEANASIEIIERIAEHYRIPPWLLLMEGLREEDFNAKNLKKLVDSYLSCDPEGKLSISSLADREALLSKTVASPPIPLSLTGKKKSNGDQ